MTKKDCRTVGKTGENAAAFYLWFHGYRILLRNWFFYRKEIDIIAKRGKTIAVCEVKSRTADPDGEHPFGTPADAVDAEKQKNLRAAGRAFVRMRNKGETLRMDIVEVYLSDRKDGRKKVRKIRHIQNAFSP